LAKIAYPNAEIDFAEPYELVAKVRGLPPDWTIAIILDLGVSLAQRREVKRAFEEASKTHEIIYVDHHYFPPGINRKTLACKEIVHRVKASASELALEHFKPPASLEYIALLGAIGDYQEHTRRMQRLVREYGWRPTYLEEFLLEQALEASRVDHPFKRKIVEGLAKGLWPSDIPNLLERARVGARRARALERHVRQHIRKIEGNIVLVSNVPFKATGPAAEYAVRMMGADVGIATYRDGNYMRLSIRRSEESDLNLNLIIGKVTLQLGGNGGGHEAAVGGRVPVEKFDNFLRQLKREISKT
jgi:RecJ-like exonuclease